MANVLELIRENRAGDLWRKCCGFIDLDKFPLPQILPGSYGVKKPA